MLPPSGRPAKPSEGPARAAPLTRPPAVRAARSWCTCRGSGWGWPAAWRPACCRTWPSWCCAARSRPSTSRSCRRAQRHTCMRCCGRGAAATQGSARTFHTCSTAHFTCEGLGIESELPNKYPICCTRRARRRWRPRRAGMRVARRAARRARRRTRAPGRSRAHAPRSRGRSAARGRRAATCLPPPAARAGAPNLRRSITWSRAGRRVWRCRGRRGPGLGGSGRGT